MEAVNPIEIFSGLIDAGVAVAIMGVWVWTLRQQNIEDKIAASDRINDLKKENNDLRTENTGLHDAGKEELKELLPLITDTTRILNEVTKEGQHKILEQLEEIKRKVSV